MVEKDLRTYLKTAEGELLRIEKEVDPLLSGLGYQAFQPHQDAIIKEAQGLLGKL